YHAPGQTKYHAFIVGEIDGKRVGFGGDNILFLNGTDLRSQKAMQSTVLRNSFQLKMHRHCAELMRNVQIDLMCPGHGELFAIDHARIEGYTQYIARKEDVFRDVVDAPADHFIDLFWVRMLPYLSETRAGETRAFTLKIRNNFDHRVTYEARLLGDHGWTAATEFTCLCLDPSEIGELTVEARAPTQPARARKLLTVEMLIDGISQGPVCEALVSTISD
ncbi:hypothetical protein O7A70_32845, partial [Mesorhizobium sp. Cs1299R1N1]|uniref:hypothetical protein n=1 Tax=Mesorhizobium sp. Cs1299R1N1 TaxID=3015172 RepID=UPI00301CB507